MSDNDFDIRDVLSGLKDVGRVLDRYGRELFSELKADIKEDMRDQKRNRRGVKGGAWAPRAQATRERAQRASKPKRRKSASTGLMGKIATAWSAVPSFRRARTPMWTSGTSKMSSTRSRPWRWVSGRSASDDPI